MTNGPTLSSDHRSRCQREVEGIGACPVAIRRDISQRMTDGRRTGKREGLNYTIARRVIELPAAAFAR
jgi:hypothetical protein